MYYYTYIYIIVECWRMPCGNQTCLGNPRTKRRFIAGKIIELNGDFSIAMFEDPEGLFPLCSRKSHVFSMFFPVK